MRVARVLRSRALLVRHVLWGGGRRGSARRARRPRPALLALVLAAALAALLYSGSAALFGALAGEGAPAGEAGVALAAVFGAGLVGLVVFDLSDAVSTLLVDSDLELLLRSPAPRAAILLLKLGDALPRSSTLLLVLVGPAAVAFAARYPLAPWAWALLPIQLAAMWMLPLGLGAGLAIHLLRAVPARMARESLSLLSTLVITLIWLGNAFLVPRLARPGGMLTGTLRDAVALLPARAWASPAHWAAAALVAGSEGGVRVALGASAALVAAGALALAFAAWTASRHLQEVQARVALPAARRRAGRAGRLRAPTFTASLLRRDARLFRRDWTVLSDVVTAAALWTLLPLVAAPLGAMDAPWLASAMLVTLAVGLGYEVAARAMPFERHALAWARLAPVPPLRWVLARLASVALLAFPLLGLAGLGVGLAFRLEPAEWARIAALALSALALSLALGLWTGLRFGDPRWTNPRAMLGLAGRLIASGMLLGQVSLWLAIYGLAERSGGRLAPGASLWGPAALALTLGAIPLVATARRLRGLEWFH